MGVDGRERWRVLLLALWVTGGTALSAAAADYIIIERAEQNYCGERPAYFGAWLLGGGGCMSIVGPGYTGGIESRWTEQMVAIGYDRGPNGVAEWGGGDDVALGPVSATWSISDTAFEAHSGLHCLTDSPDGLYGENWDVSATIDRTFDLGGYDTIELSFWHHWNLRYNSQLDSCVVEVRTAGSSDWEWLTGYHYACGFHGVFYEETLDLAAYADSVVSLRFRLISGPSYESDGWFIDDVRLLADGELLFFDDLENGTDRWILENEWGLTGQATELIYLDRNNIPMVFPVSRDIYGVRCASINPLTGLMRAIPVGLPTQMFEGEGYTWVVATHNGSRDATMVYNSAMCYVPE